MQENYFDIIEEFGTGDVLYFYYAQKNKKWGIIDIDHDEIIPCEHMNKPELVHFEEYFKLDSKDKSQVLFYPDYYAYEMIFRILDSNKKYNIQYFHKNLMPEGIALNQSADKKYDDIRIISKERKIQVVDNNEYATFSFDVFFKLKKH